MVRKRRRIRDENGQVMVEAAIVLPLILLVLLAIAQFGVVLSHYINLTDAVRVAGRAATTCRFPGSKPYDQAGNGASGGMAITWGLSPSCNSTTGGGNLTVTGTAVKKENLNVFGLMPTFASITLTSTVTVVEE
jgi:Flp pilus assembly protein TadG